MMHSLPRLRPDLVLSEQRQGEARVFVVKDPVTGRFLRLGEPACFIARQLDGATPLEVIRSRVREELGEDLSAEQVDEFVGTLRRLDLLDGEGTGGSSAPARRRVRGDLLYLRFPAFDPNPLLQ